MLSCATASGGRCLCLFLLAACVPHSRATEESIDRLTSAVRSNMLQRRRASPSNMLQYGAFLGVVESGKEILDLLSMHLGPKQNKH